MVNQIAEFTASQTGDASDEDQQLEAVRSSVERFFFQKCSYFIPAVYVLYVVFEYIDQPVFPDALLDLVKITTQIVFVIAFILANRFFEAIPYTISQLFSSSAITQKTSDTKLKKFSYQSFVNDLDSWLNRGHRRIMGVLGALFALTYYMIRTGGPSELVEQAAFSLAFVDLILYILPTVIYAYFAGIVVWKLLVTSRKIGAIPLEFDVNVQFGHPDGAGGLLPVGLLCLSMVYVTIAPTFRAVLIFLASYIGENLDFPHIVANDILLLGFAPVILIVGIIGSIVALSPMHAFHQVMLKHRHEIARLLNRVSAEIVALKEQIATMPQNAEMRAVDETLKRISDLETFYGSHQNINTWPMNRQVLIRVWASFVFLIAQVVALWNFISSF